MNNTVRLFSTLLLIAYTPLMYAEKRFPFKPSEIELMALPDYCQARLGNNKDAQQPWIQRMGKENFSHLHHYCAGLVYVNRVRVSNGSKHQLNYLQTASAQFAYVIDRWPETFYLKPEAKSYKSQMDFQITLKSKSKKF